MVGRFFLISVLLVTFVSAQDIDKLLAKHKANHYVDNPCTGNRFARNPRGCAWFFVCDDDNQILEQNRCPGDHYFSEADQLCDIRERIPCDIPFGPIECPEEMGVNIVRHPYSCSKYTICFDGIINDRVCERGLHFSYYDGRCVDPFLADCDIDFETCRESVESGIPAVVGDPRDCRSYYVCVGGTSVLLRCADGHHFDTYDEWCITPEATNCSPNVPENQPEIPDKTYIDCEGRSGVSLAHPDSCQFFFFCAGDRSYLQICGEGLVFDVTSARCQAENLALCIRDVPTEPPPTIPPTEPPATDPPTSPPEGGEEGGEGEP